MWKTWALAAFAIALLGVIWVIGAPDGRAAGTLASHRATYELTLGDAKQNSNVNGVRGRLVVEWQDACDGFTTNQRLFTEFLTDSGGATASDIWLSSWEARDGSLFRFTLTSRSDGNIDEKVRGEARRGPGKATAGLGGKKGVGGEAVYSEPAGARLALPEGVIFPTAHTQALIDAAREGTRVIDRAVFDGSLKDGLSQVSAFIGAPLGKKPDSNAKGLKNAGKLLSGQSWPVRLAFFSPKKADALPDYEFSFRLYENGVASDLKFDYGDFTVAGKLTELTPLPGCNTPEGTTPTPGSNQP